MMRILNFMKKYYFVYCFIILSISCSSFGNNNTEWEIDTYVEMTLTQVIELLGESKYINEKIIDNNYLPTPVEPPYSDFFTEEELKNNIKITLAKWLNGNREILIYLKSVNDDLIVFTSVNQRIKKSNIFIRYL